MTHAHVWQALWCGGLFSGIESHHVVAPDAPVTVRVRVKATYGGGDFNSGSLCIVVLVIDADTFLYFTCVLIPHNRKSVYKRRMISQLAVMSTEVSCGQVWCHRQITHHFCSTWMETLQKGVCLCCVLYIDGHRCSPNKDGHFKNVWNFEKCSNVLKRGNVGVQRRERESYRWWSSMTFDSISILVCNHLDSTDTAVKLFACDALLFYLDFSHKLDTKSLRYWPCLRW